MRVKRNACHFGKRRTKKEEKQMKNTRKLITSIVLLLMLAASVVGFTACLGGGPSGGDGDGTCSHEWGEWTTTKTADCDTAGERERVCAKCDEKETETIAMTDHVWQAATCEAPKTCKNCGATEGEIGTHSYTYEIANEETMKSPATEKDAAVYYKSCVCGAISESDADTFEYGGNLGHVHSFTEKTVKDAALKSPATCFAKAVYFMSCECGVISTSGKDTFSYGTVAEHKDEDKNHACDVCTTTVSTHTYEDGVCTVCGKSENKACDHTELHTETIDLGELGACGGIIYLETCECGEVSEIDTDHARLVCDIDFSDEGETVTGEDGKTYIKKIDTCSVCGLEFNVLSYEEKIGCKSVSEEWYTLIIDGEAVRENAHYKYEYYNHYPTEIKVIDLAEFGACGGNLFAYACEDCGTYTRIDRIVPTCKTDFTVTPEEEEFTDSDGNVHRVRKIECPDCHLTMTEDEWVQEISVCESLVHYSKTLRCGDTVIIDLTDNEPELNHELEYTYNLEGGSCEDGYLLIMHCTKCGITVEMPSVGHNSEEFILNLTEIGGCGGTIAGRRCSVCGDVTYLSSFDVNSCKTTSTSETVTDSDGISHGVITSICSTCGLKFVMDSWKVTVSECVERTFQTLTIYKDATSNNPIFEYIYYEDDENHVREDSYELAPGSSCENSSYKVISTCTICGDVDYWYTSGHSYEYKEYDLAELGACGGQITVRECEVCGYSEVDSWYTNCSYDEIDSHEGTGEDGLYHSVSIVGCLSCGFTETTDRWTENKSECEYVDYTKTTLKIGDTVFEKIDEFTGHNHEYENEYHPYGDDCNDGYLVVSACKNCGYSYSYSSSGHAIEFVYIYFNELGLCGGDAFEEHCAICKKIISKNANDYYCYWQYVENKDGVDIYECGGCHATKKISYADSEKNEYCEYTHTETMTYIVNGEVVYEYSYEYAMTEHEYVHQDELLGETCYDGLHRITTCKNCDYYSDETLYYHVSSTVFTLPEGLTCCTEHNFAETNCPCGDNHYIEYDSWNYDYTEDTESGAEILTCQDCGLTITIYRTETEVDGMTSVTVRYVITYGGEEIYSTEETY